MDMDYIVTEIRKGLEKALKSYDVSIRVEFREGLERFKITICFNNRLYHFAYFWENKEKYNKRVAEVISYMVNRVIDEFKRAVTFPNIASASGNRRVEEFCNEISEYIASRVSGALCKVYYFDELYHLRINLQYSDCFVYASSYIVDLSTAGADIIAEIGEKFIEEWRKNKIS